MKKMATMLLVTFLALPLAAQAQQKGNIELKSVAEVDVTEANAQGQKVVKRVDAAAAKVVPGDVVIFTTTYKNISKEPADNIVITNPVPEHMDYVDKSAEGKGAKIDFSVDKGKSYEAADKLQIVDKAGKSRKALSKDITHIRWTLTKPLAPGGSGSVSFKAKLQ
jgi:uncharacterized repeat protein (TIGR01451 family)